MTKIALIGYRHLMPETAALVDDAIRTELSRSVHGSHHDAVGITCLAPGAQQLFARAVADFGGDLDVVVPTDRYREELPDECRPEYDSLLVRARRVHRLPPAETAEAAYREAGCFMLVLAERVFAVWDRAHPAAEDSTDDLVATAGQRGLPVTVIWPQGAQHQDNAH